MTGFPKPRPHALAREKKKAVLTAKDRIENRKVKLRAGGRCEVRFEDEPGRGWRCWRLPMPGVHHLIYGSGRRNVGNSILAEHKLAVCQRCHDNITHRVLVPVAGFDRERAATVRYRRQS